MSLTHEVWQDMAGDCYPYLVGTKEAAMAHLFNSDSNVRIAAIHICDSVWDCSSDPSFVATCRRIAETDNDDDVRVHAISMLGKALQASKEPGTSKFLANLVKSNTSSADLRRAAYWALREVQFGETPDDNVKHSMALMKVLLRKHPKELSEDQVKQSLFGSGDFPTINWDTVDQIDLDFVNQYLSFPKMPTGQAAE